MQQGGGMMGRGNPGRGMPGRGRGGPDMMHGMGMPNPEFFGGMNGMGMPMGMGPMMHMGPNPMMMGMADMDFNRMGGFDNSMAMANMASMGMGMGNPMGNPMMMGMGEMGGGFPMAMAPPRPPPRRMPVQEESIRPSNAPPFTSDRMYKDERTDGSRDKPRSYSRYCKGSWQVSTGNLETLLPGSPVFYAVN